VNCFAEEIEVPKLFKDSKITVTLKNGETYNFDGNKYMVVKRKAKVNISAILTEDNKKDKPLIFKEKQKESNKNRVRVMAGVGPNGFSVNRKKDTVKVRTEQEELIGIGFDRLLDDKMSINGQAISNGTLMLGLGLDF
jgi:hypothetical protein